MKKFSDLNHDELGQVVMWGAGLLFLWVCVETVRQDEQVKHVRTYFEMLHELEESRAENARLRRDR